MKTKAAAMEEMSEEMLREKLETIESKEQLGKNMECLWAHVHPQIDEMVTLHTEINRKMTELKTLAKEIRCKYQVVAELARKAIRKETEVPTLYTKAKRTNKKLASVIRKKSKNEILVDKYVKRKCAKGLAALSAAVKREDEIFVLHTEIFTMKNRITELISKATSDASEIEETLIPHVKCKRDQLNTLLTMIKDKKIAVDALHHETSEGGSARAPSGNSTAGLHDVLSKATHLFGASKIAPLFHNL